MTSRCLLRCGAGEGRERREKRDCEGLYRGKQWCHWMTIAGCGKMVTPVESDAALAPAGEGLHYEFLPFKRVTLHCFCMWISSSQFLWIGSFHCSFFLFPLFSLAMSSSPLLTPQPPPPLPVCAQVRVHMCAHARVKPSTRRHAALTGADW